jgi:ABC-2 type transport system permease protein
MTSGTQREGQVFDLGYRHYQGPREGRRRARMAIYIDGLRAAMGIGRGGRAKILPWAFIGVMVLISLGMAVAASTVDRAAGEGTAEAAGLPSYSDYYAVAAIILFLFGAVVGPELLCPDRKNGTINLYLVRPLTTIDYVGARWVAFLTVMVLITWLPQVVLLAGLAGGADDPAKYLQDNWRDVPKFLAVGAATAMYITNMGLAVASFTTRRGYASVALIGLLILTQIASGILGSAIEGTAGEWLSLVSLSDIPLHINELVFHTDDSLAGGSAARDLPSAVRLGAYFVATFGALAVLWARYRRIGA